jgi:hypothetical protein
VSRTARFRLILSAALLLSPFPLSAADAPPQPVFIADLQNPNDFVLFANGGWDGNWYVGFNTCWIQKVAVPKGEWKRAYIGARLGRMKSAPAPDKAPWNKKPIPGEVYMAFNSTPSWNRQQSFFLTDSKDIPLEPDPENAVEGTGESRWFWKEIPVKLVQPGNDAYLALWSPTQALGSAASAPILAAGWGTKEVDSWMNTDIKGVPPSNPAKSLSTPIQVFEPAIALKLIPANAPEEKPRPRITRVTDGKPRGRDPAPKVVWAQISGESIERAWVEVSSDTRNWSRLGGFAWNAPYCFTLKTQDLTMGADGKTWVRAAAADAFENVGFSDSVNVFEGVKP